MKFSRTQFNNNNNETNIKKTMNVCFRKVDHFVSNGLSFIYIKIYLFLYEGIITIIVHFN